jgi:hydroxyquinol 1,2-dioxygenase
VQELTPDTIVDPVLDQLAAANNRGCPIPGLPSLRFDMRLSRETAADETGGHVGADPSAILKQPA